MRAVTLNKILKGRTHIVIGDTQVKRGVPMEHLGWIGRYIVDQFAGRNVSIIHLGDHYDMPSLSSYDKGKKEMEGRRYVEDIKAGNRGMDILCAPLERYNASKRSNRRWHPEMHFLLGNHEARIARACEEDAQLDGVIGYGDFNLEAHGWKVHGFLEPVTLDGVVYSHYFYNPNTGRPLAGENLETRLQKIGHTFTMGHQQGMKRAIRPVGKARHCGLVLGSTYLHDEKYLGPQSKDYWRGIVVCHQVERGQYDAMEVSLDWLCRRYERKPLKVFMKEKGYS